jgi:hypothetical protein
MIRICQECGPPDIDASAKPLPREIGGNPELPLIFARVPDRITEYQIPINCS